MQIRRHAGALLKKSRKEIGKLENRQIGKSGCTINKVLKKFAKKRFVILAIYQLTKNAKSKTRGSPAQKNQKRDRQIGNPGCT